jgi:ADP-heptose:LPS heptosyltransferase
MRILFVTSNRLGDAVLSSGVLAELVRRFPGTRFTVACGAVPKELFSAVPRLERIIVVEKAPLDLHWLKLWSETVVFRWRVVVDLRGSGLSWLLFTRERRIAGRARGDEHRVQNFARVLGSASPIAPEIFVSAEARRRAAEIIPQKGRALALGPTANWPGKQWPAERFAELARHLTASGAPLAGAPVVIFGAPGERPMIEPFFRALPEACVIDLVGKVDLLTAYACLERAALFVGNDSGLMHLAAASGAPTLGLFGPSREAHYRPWGRLTATVRGQSYESIVQARDFDRLMPVSHMHAITADAAAEAARALLLRAREEAPLASAAP